MAFFKKLKDRLFKSSSKLDEGLGAIVEDGGTTEAAQDPMVTETQTSPTDAGSEPSPEPIPPTSPPDADPAAPDDAITPQRPQQTPASDLGPDLADTDAPVERPAPTSVQSVHDAQVRPIPEPSPLPLEPKPEPEPEIVLEPRRESPDLPPRQEVPSAPLSQPDLPPVPAPSPQITPDPKPGVETRRDLKQEPDLPPSTPSRPEATASAPPVPPMAPPPSTEPPRTETQEPTKPGILGRLFGRREQATVLRRALDDDMLEQLEELLIASDMGVDTALRVTANMAEGRMGKRLSVQEIKELLAAEIARIMDPVARPLPIYPKTPQVVLVVGVNGSGKTTTIGKLASQFRAAGKSVVIAAGDTFRAAAVEQLQVWGERAGVPVLTAPEGTDPASLAFDAMAKATQDGADLLMIDTAGRLQNRADLMEELAKIVRVIRKQDPDAPHNTLLVLDATTGQNALNQVKIFQEVSDVSGLVMTKLDGTAKGGVLVALADKFGLPIHAIGVGEQIDDLAPFDPEEFAAALTGLDTQ